MSLDTSRIVILSGPSGVGKDTVLDRWAELNPQVRRVVAATTRAPRAGEIDGDDYHFMEEVVFLEAAKNGQFLEYKNVHGNWYATPWAGIESIVTAGGIAVLKIDVQGAEQVLKDHPAIISIFLLPPSMAELERRIRARGTESEETLATRLQNARDEIEASHFYRHRLVNRDVNEVVGQLQEIVS